MQKEGMASQRLTQGDKTHKKNMERSKIFEGSLKQVFNSSIVIHKQTVDAKNEDRKSQLKLREAEQANLYDLIKDPEIDEKTKAWARDKIEKNSHAQEREDKNFDEFLENAENKSYTIIRDGLILSALVVSSLFTLSTKQGRQIIKKIPAMGKTLLQ